MKNILSSLLCLLLLSSVGVFAQKAELVLPAAHSQPVEGMAFSPDGKFFITIGDDEPLRVWDVATKRLFKSFPFPAFSLAVSADSRMVIVLTARSLKILDLQRMDFVKEIAVPSNTIEFNKVALAPVSNMILVAAYKKEPRETHIYKLDLSTYALQQLASNPQVSYGASWDCFDFTSDGKKVLVSTYEFGAILYNVQPFVEEKRYNEESKVFGMAPDGLLVSLKEGFGTSNRGGTYTFMDAKTMAVKEKFDVPDGDQWNISAAKRHKFVGKTGHNMLVHDEGDVWYYDGLSKRVNVLFHNPSKYEDKFERIEISSDSKMLAIGKSSPLLFRLNGSVAQSAGSFGSPMMWMWNLATSTAKNELVVCDIGDFARLIQLDAAGFGLDRFPAETSGGPLALSPNGKSLFVGGNNPGLGWQYNLTMPTVSPLAFNLRSDFSMEDAAYSPDGKYLVCQQVEVLTVVNASTGQRVYNTPARGKYSLPLGKNSLAFSPDSKKVVFFHLPQDTKQPDTYLAEPHVTCLDLATGNVLWDKVLAANGFQFTPDGSKIIAFDETNVNDRQNKVLEIDARSGAVLQSWNLGAVNVSQWAFCVSPDGRTVLNGSANGNLELYDVATRRLVSSMKGHDLGVKFIKFLKNTRYAVSIGYDNTVRFYDLQARKQLAQMVLFNNGEWAVLTEEGRFDASDGALKMMYYVKGKEFISLESLYERYYTPKLLQSMLGGEKLEPVPVDVETIKSPPTVKIKFDRTKSRNLSVEDDIETVESSVASVTLTIEAESKESAIAEIRLFHNGKLVDAGTRNLVVEDDTPAPSGGDRQTRNYTINLLAGDNTFKAIALNAQRTESKPAELIIRYKPATPTPGTNTGSSGVTLHLMVIGINAYKNPKYNLNYAQADASGFKTALNKNCGKIVKTCKEHFLTDAQAVKANILAEFEKVVAEAKPEDVFVLYYAGHGVMTETDKQFFLVPHDVTQLYGNDGALAQKGLSANELKAFAQRIKAQKQLFILDACQSSGALETIAARGAAEEKAISQLARATGTHWLTAAGSQQFASEFAQLGHGVFTYALLDGLAGKADANGDGQITVKEIDAYLQDVVPTLTEKHKGTPQFPSSYGFGNDFPLGVK
jgi:WD40 repeat protein